MSNEEPTPIEKNGNYWLSSDNAYHIINPTATSLIDEETIGNYHLATGGDTYYVLDGNGNSTRLDDPDVTNMLAADNPFEWSLLQVEATAPRMLGGEGYALLWHTVHYLYQQNLGYHVTNNSISGDQTALWPRGLDVIESHFRVDLDGGGITIKANQAYHSIDISGNQHHLDDGHGSDSIILKKNDVTIDPNSNPSWNVTQVEDSGTGYEVFWSHSSGRFEVWKVDDSGNYESHVTAHLWQHENTFKVDLNGDGTTGLRAIETTGDVHLALGDNKYSGDTKYYIVDGIKAPIALTKAGAPRGPTDGGWNVTQVENSGEGYEVFWARSSGRFEVWKVDDSGNYESHVTAHLWQHENTFGVDLNGDGIDSGNNNIYGSIGNDTFDGGAGDDIINGREGHDTLIGGEGNDWLSGDGGSGYAGNDILFGNAGNDDLRGRDGNDQIDGGTGSDTITTGSGLDKIILRIGDGGNTLSDADIITDFTDGSDNFVLDGGLLFSQLVIAQGSGDYASDTIISAGSKHLAILQGIDERLLSDVDFETVDIA